MSSRWRTSAQLVAVRSTGSSVPHADLVDGQQVSAAYRAKTSRGRARRPYRRGPAARRPPSPRRRNCSSPSLTPVSSNGRPGGARTVHGQSRYAQRPRRLPEDRRVQPGSQAFTMTSMRCSRARVTRASTLRASTWAAENRPPSSSAATTLVARRRSGRPGRSGRRTPSLRDRHDRRPDAACSSTSTRMGPNSPVAATDSAVRYTSERVRTDGSTVGGWPTCAPCSSPRYEEPSRSTEACSAATR